MNDLESSKGKNTSVPMDSDFFKAMESRNRQNHAMQIKSLIVPQCEDKWMEGNGEGFETPTDVSLSLRFSHLSEQAKLKKDRQSKINYMLKSIAE